MSDFLRDAFSAVSGAEWEEVPVDIETFVTSEDYLHLPPLSKYQYQIVRAASQIYRKETLIALYGEEKGLERWDETCTEVVLQLGKGSGKDFTSTVAVCYIVYLLLCLKDPAHYYGKPRGDAIDIINVAINADQAKNVFFKGIREKIINCPWFIGKYEIKNNSIEFDKNVTVYSGHSQREAFEGLNLLVAVLDEISGFALESNTGNELADTADATYQMYRNSVDSRFSLGKVIMLSFPRFRGDYIQQRYGPDFNDPDKGIIGAVAEKEVITRTHTFKINEDLPDGTEGNEFTIEWEEDHITRYSFPGLFALRRPTWEVNPTKNIDDFKRNFLTNKADALGRYACMPSDSVDSTFFKNKDAIETSFIAENGVDIYGVFSDKFTPRDREYFIHVDLSKVHDRCAVALAHVDKWVSMEGDKHGDLYPMVRVDAVRWWKPSKDQPMDYKEVTDYILSLKRRGFNIKLVTFDRWNSHDTMNFLQSRGIDTELLSVATKHYDDFLTVMYDERLIGPKVPELITELRELRYMHSAGSAQPKVDHPRSGFKDLSDAVCGAIFNAISRTQPPRNKEIEVVSFKSLMRDAAQEQRPDGVISAPKRKMPDKLAQAIADIDETPLRFNTSDIRLI